MALIGIFLFGQDPQQVMEQLGAGQQQAQTAPADSGQYDEAKDFLSVVLADTEDVWDAIFSEAGQRYPQPTFVIFSQQTPTACGTGQAAAGPFYCPGDQKLYMDLVFLNELQRLGARGDFAIAYVVAHEVGHHVQTVTGTSAKVRAAQQRARSKTDANVFQVRMELQADCYAGVWAHHAHRQRQILESGDIEEAMEAAASVGDDRLQRGAGRPVRPESFTHGSSAERTKWFRRGIETGRIDSCDTFAGA